MFRVTCANSYTVEIYANQFQFTNESPVVEANRNWDDLSFHHYLSRTDFGAVDGGRFGKQNLHRWNAFRDRPNLLVDGPRNGRADSLHVVQKQVPLEIASRTLCSIRPDALGQQSPSIA